MGRRALRDGRQVTPLSWSTADVAGAALYGFVTGVLSMAAAWVAHDLVERWTA